MLHMASRGGSEAPPGDDVEGARADFLAFAESVRTGGFTDVINIGIGGSDLGPAMAVRALSPDNDGPRMHFVSNVDGAHLADTLRGLDPVTTLVIVASKTFTTLETMTNARSARTWLGGHAADNMAAVSTNLAACAEFGVPAERGLRLLGLGRRALLALGCDRTDPGHCHRCQAIPGLSCRCRRDGPAFSARRPSKRTCRSCSPLPASGGATRWAGRPLR